MPLSPLASSYDVLLLDLDGCVWVGDEPTAGAVEALDAVRAAGRAVAFVTNDSRDAPEDFVRKLWRLGFRAAVEEVVTVGGALQHVLNERHAGRSAYVIGSPAVHRHVLDAGMRVVNGTAFDSRAEVVVVAGDERVVDEELRCATQAVRRGAELVGAGPDAPFPRPAGAWPATGAVHAAVEAAPGDAAGTVANAAPPRGRRRLDRLGAGDRALVVGDRLDADVAGAAAAGLDAAVVLTGATSADAAREALAAARAKRDAPDAAPGGLVALAPTLAALMLS